MSGTTTTIDLYCFGVRSATEAEFEPSPALRLKPAGTGGAGSVGYAELQKQLDRGSTEWVAVADADCLATVPEAAAELEEIVCTPEPPEPGLHLHWNQERSPQSAGGFCTAALLNELPSRLTAFVVQPERTGVILARRADLYSAVKQKAVPETDSHGLWPLLVAMSEAGKSFHLLMAEPETDLPPLVQRNSPAPGWLRRKLQGLNISRLIPSAVSVADATAVQSGLLLLHDLSEQSHMISQSIQGQGRRQAGDCWHMIVHRREPDYSNARYWCRQFGMHPAATELAAITDGLLSSSSHPDATGWNIRLTSGGMWHATEYVDLCARCVETKDQELTSLTQQIQYAEMLLLLGESYRDAITL